jgi:bifunctional DNase/RNase
MNEMVIDSIRVSLENYQRVVILKQKEGDRYLLIWIGTHEAEAIAVRLQDVQVPRPLTHYLLHNTIKEMGGTVEKVTVSGLENDTYFARIGVRIGERSVEIDSRPSDALAIAVRAGVPIFVDDQVMEKAGVLLDKETGNTIVGSEGVSSQQAGGQREHRAPVGKEELKKLSAFQDFIESMDMGGFGDEGSTPPSED